MRPAIYSLASPLTFVEIEGMELKSVESLGREFRDTLLRLLRDYSEALVLALVLAVVLRVFVFASYKVANLNMEPNLKLGDFILGYRLPYGFHIPFTQMHVGKAHIQRGQVLIFRCPMQPDLNCVKRVVGLPGDRIEIKKQKLFINGRPAKYALLKEQPVLQAEGGLRLKAFAEKHKKMKNKVLLANDPEIADFGPYVVPPESFFALGDNRYTSEDSRHWGAISYSAIESRAVFIWLSIEWVPLASGRYASQVRWDRLFSSVD
jgi:signal peptidase I